MKKDLIEIKSILAHDHPDAYTAVQPYLDKLLETNPRHYKGFLSYIDDKWHFTFSDLHSFAHGKHYTDVPIHEEDLDMIETQFDIKEEGTELICELILTDDFKSIAKIIKFID